MTVKIEDTFYFNFGTSSPTTGAATNADSTPSVAVEEDGVAMVYAPAVTNVATGLYRGACVASAANGFEVGKRYSGYAVAAVGGVTGRDGVFVFQVVAREQDELALETGGNLATVMGKTNNLPTDPADESLLEAAIAGVLADTNDLQSRLPTALVSGRIDASVGAMAAGVVTPTAVATGAIDADAIAADAVTEIQAGLATTANVSAVETDTQDIQSRLPAALVSGRMSSYVGAMAGDIIAAATIAADAITEIQAGLATAAALATVQADTDNLQTRLPAALVGGRMDSNVQALANDILTAAALAADAITEIQAGLATAAALATVQSNVTDIKAKTDNLPSGIKKNTALAKFSFLMVDSGDHVTPKTGVTITAQRSLDGAAFGACANGASELSNGIYLIDLATGDLNGDVVTLRFTAAGADARLLTVITEP
jgi:hypothetical protein